MYKSIVVAVDDSDLSLKALRHATELARSLGAKVTAVTVTELPLLIAPGAEIAQIQTASLMDEMERANAERAGEILRAARAAVPDATIETQHVKDSHPSDGILLAARDTGADLIVMGSHGRRGLGRLLLGSQATEVLTRSTIPVLVVR